MDLGIAGRVALVTGSHRGTGSAIAASLAAEGARVLVHGFEPGQPDAVVEAIVSRGGSARGIVGDLSSDVGAAALLEAAGDLDIVVCNYGVAQGGRWSNVSTDAWVDAYDRNVLTAVRVAAGAAPALVERGWGRIVLLGTVGTVRPAAVRPQYYGSKAALPALTVSLAKELAGSGVTVNLVSPGLIATQEVLDRLADRLVAEVFPGMSGRIALPSEVADLVTYVCSEQAGAITGSNFRIDGGSTDVVQP
ncbi:MAG: SDR family oxidoreductase [Actinomycetota bacterium]|nr:SDR family oxidoreductase [Actinomycetota bacterium]